MAKEKTMGQEILEQKEKEVVFIPAKLLRQGRVLDLFESKEDRLDEVNSRNNLVDITEVNVIPIAIINAVV